MGVRSFVFTVLLIALCCNVYYLSTSHTSTQHQKRSTAKKATVKRNPIGGPINHYPVIKSVKPRNEDELEKRYDPATCGFTDGQIIPTSGKSVQVECGVIHSGLEYRNVEDIDYNDCIDECGLDIQCVALAWNKRAEFTGYCILQKTIAPPRISRGTRHDNWVGGKVVSVEVIPER